MPEIPTPATKLDAVNAILSTINEGPLNTLDGVESLDAIRAIDDLTNTQREVLSQGWWFNTETLDLVPTSDGEYVLGSHYLKAVPRNRLYRGRFVERARKLYDRENNRFDGNTAAIELDVVLSLDFEDLPQTARQYIFLRAARVWSTKTIGERLLYTITAQDEARALVQLQRENLANSNTTMLDNPSVAPGRSENLGWR